MDAARRDIASAVSLALKAGGHGDRTEEAAAEALPVLEATLAATQADRTASDRHEALALAALLGRRAVGLRLSPTATLALFSAIATVARTRGATLATEFESALVACGLEGFVAADGERVRAEFDAQTADGVRAYRLTDRALCVPVPATVGPDALETALDRVARALLSADADTCIVLVLGAPDARDESGCVSALVGLGASAHVVGAQVVFVAESERMRQALSRAVPEHLVVESLAVALAKLDIVVTRATKPLSQLKKFFSGR